MIEPRVYRAAFMPAVLAVVLAMFSLEGQPPAVPLDLAADVLFQGDSAGDTAAQIARQQPDRRPGTPGDAAVADLVAARFTEHGFDVEVDEFEAGGEALVNVVGTRSGSARERIAVIAARDADAVPDVSGSAADTAALLELAAALEGRAPEKTIVLASIDGSTFGDAGARRFAETVADRELIEAALVLSDVGAADPDGPRLVAWSNDLERGSVGLDRTAGEALRSEFESASGGERASTQLAQLALPVGIGAQGVLLEHGIEAVRFSGSGVLPPDPEPSEADADRIGGIGRAVLQTVSAIDAAESLEHGPSSYVTVGRNLLPGWAVSVLALCLLLPACVASVDAFARARRRRQPVGRWGSWLTARIVPFAVGLLVALLLVVAGLAPDAGGAAPAPSIDPLDAGAVALLGVVAASIALAWLFLRPLLGRWGGAPADPTAPGAGCTLALVISAVALLVWLLNPWAALALVPAAHLWTLAALYEGPRRTRARALMVAGGLALPAAVALSYMVRLSLDPVEALWYLFLLVTGGQVDLLGALGGCVLLGALASVIEIVAAWRGRTEAVEEAAPTVRGPGGYAGPGSLGGTESALKR